jgi:serine/threonine protein kinase
MVARSSPNWPLFLWHDHVHRYKRGERLFFWRAAFEPTYERDIVAAAIDTACEQHGVKGVITYELFGAYDLLVRLWLPEDCSFAEFDLALTVELKPAGLSLCEPFEVKYAVRHWPFVDDDGRPSVPEPRLIHRLSEGEIHEVEMCLPEARPELLVRLCSQRLLYLYGDGDGQGGQPVRDEPGIKFAITVNADPELAQEQLDELEEHLVEILARAGGVRQRSLYTGAGFGHFLIMGRVDYVAFHEIHANLITQINAADVRERYGVHTMTALSGQRGYHIAREGLSLNGAGDGRRQIAMVQSRRKEIIDPDHVLQPGDELGERFEIREHLGGGGFANVYRAFDRYERVERALKIFKSSQREVALREIAALRKVNHPNVVKVYWGDHEGPRWYLVCEFIEGVNLNRCSHGGDVWALEIVVQVLRALEAVHPDDVRIAELEERSANGVISLEDFRELQMLRSVGLVHRDVKPDNIMVGEDGQATLVDFNIASPARQPGDTHSGTPEYLAPDAGLIQWEPSDDLFACGVVLYELLIGRHPYPDGKPIAGVSPIDPLTVRADLRPSLARTLVRACAPLRADRHQTAHELRAELEAELGALKAIARGVDTEADRIARVLRHRRTDRDMGISTLSDVSGVPPERIEAIERGETSEVPDALRIMQVLLGGLEHILRPDEKDAPGDRGDDVLGQRRPAPGDGEDSGQHAPPPT